ncbi:MAG TPA: hypothetical protein VGY98_18475 [Verrucomicrobiae bacterium]|nr:hypothetical protein [Verrucomicrobiae bacterium]
MPVQSQRKRFAVYLGAPRLDSWLELQVVEGQHIHLDPTSEKILFEPRNGYHIIPLSVVEACAGCRIKPTV